MFEYATKLHPYTGDTRPEETFPFDVQALAEARWELVAVVPVLGKMDLVSFWKRAKEDATAAISQAVVRAEEILDAALINDPGRGELLDAAQDALNVLTAALPAIPHRAPADPDPTPPSKTPMVNPDEVYRNLVSQLGPIGMEDRSEPLPPPVPDETNEK